MSTNLAKLKEVKERHNEELLRLPNVNSLGIGPKLVAGKPTSIMAIKVYVERKVPRSGLAEGQRIPEEIEGIPTDVEMLAPLHAR